MRTAVEKRKSERLKGKRVEVSHSIIKKGEKKTIIKNKQKKKIKIVLVEKKSNDEQKKVKSILNENDEVCQDKESKNVKKADKRNIDNEEERLQREKRKKNKTKLRKVITVKTKSKSSTGSGIENEDKIDKEKDGVTDKFICPICERKCKSGSGLGQHLKNSHVTFCRVCDIDFLSEDEINKHLEIHNIYTREDGKRMYSCNVCGLQFKDAHKLKTHKRCHSTTSQFKCDFCNQMLKTEDTLKYHIKTLHDSTQEKKWKCEVCSKAFWSRSELNKHIRVHTNERPYLCHICSMAFKTIGNLISHQQSLHGTKQWLCEDCGQTFTTRKKYLHHCYDRNHGSVIKPGLTHFPCEECGKIFNRKNDLKVHFRIHTGLKPYKCDQCGRDFRCLNHLRQHEVTHTGRKPFPCKFCQKGFSQYANVNVHMKKCKLRSVKFDHGQDSHDSEKEIENRDDDVKTEVKDQEIGDNSKNKETSQTGLEHKKREIEKNDNLAKLVSKTGEDEDFSHKGTQSEIVVYAKKASSLKVTVVKVEAVKSQKALNHVESTKVDQMDIYEENNDIHHDSPETHKQNEDDQMDISEETNDSQHASTEKDIGNNDQALHVITESQQNTNEMIEETTLAVAPEIHIPVSAVSGSEVIFEDRSLTSREANVVQEDGNMIFAEIDNGIIQCVPFSEGNSTNFILDGAVSPKSFSTEYESFICKVEVGNEEQTVTSL